MSLRVDVVLEYQVIFPLALFMSDLQVAAFEPTLKYESLILKSPRQVVRSHWRWLLRKVSELVALLTHSVIFF